MAKTENISVDAPAAPADTTPVAETVAPRSGRRGLVVGGTIAGGVLAAALLFGGGVLLGTHLPHGDRPPMEQSMLQGPQQGPLQGPQQGPPAGGPGTAQQGYPGEQGPQRGDRP